jgi:hypothetical protein
MKMKKNSILIIMGFFSSFIYSQDITDALRYSQDNLLGTARFSAMSGAFGALGGDFSSINVNPAGSAIFANNQVALTTSTFGVKNKSNYFGSKDLENSTTADINQFGAVFVIKNTDKNSEWTKFSFALNYENANNLDNVIFSSGTNPTNSIGDYFKYYANRNNGVSILNLQTQPRESITDLYDYLGSNYGFGAQQAFLGYQAYIIDPASNYNESSNRNYVSLIPSGGNYYQENYIKSNGYNGKLSFNASGQYNDKFYFGVNINTRFIDYTQNTTFYEDNSNNLVSGVQRLQFDNELTTFGNGISFQLGAIAKLNKQVRVGVAYESPTWYEISDKLSQRISSVSANATGELPIVRVNPMVINVYEPYQLSTPGKWTGSLGYIYKKSGILSIDYSIKDYGNIEFSPNGDYRELNSEIKNNLGMATELRIGGEYRIKAVSLRAGYRSEKSPYRDQTTIGNLTGFSSGFGYNFGGSKLDITYSHSQRDYQKQFFNVGMTDSSKINSVMNNVIISMSFEL